MLDSLEARLLENPFYGDPVRGEEYKYPRGRDGEIDLYAPHKHTVFVFEAKSGFKESSYDKAREQLRRGALYLVREYGYRQAVMFSYTAKYGLRYEGKTKRF